jgi:hypothetical protein
MVVRRLNVLKQLEYSLTHRHTHCFQLPSPKDTAMNSIHSRLNPFVLMLDPEAVISAMEGSTNLRGLRQRICRPLDKPLIPKTHSIDRIALRDYDAVIDAEEFMDSGIDSYVEAQPALQSVH